MRRYTVITTVAIFLGIVAFLASRRSQVWIGHENIHQNSLSYAGQFSSLEACRQEVEKYGGDCSSKCRSIDNDRGGYCKLIVTIEAKH